MLKFFLAAKSRAAQARNRAALSATGEDGAEMPFSLGTMAVAALVAAGVAVLLFGAWAVVSDSISDMFDQANTPPTTNTGGGTLS